MHHAGSAWDEALHDADLSIDCLDLFQVFGTFLRLDGSAYSMDHLTDRAWAGTQTPK